MTAVRVHKDVLGAIMIAAVVISLYSVWGAHVLGGGSEVSVATNDQNLR